MSPRDSSVVSGDARDDKFKFCCEEPISRLPYNVPMLCSICLYNFGFLLLCFCYFRFIRANYVICNTYDFVSSYIANKHTIQYCYRTKMKNEIMCISIVTSSSGYILYQSCLADDAMC